MEKVEKKQDINLFFSFLYSKLINFEGCLLIFFKNKFGNFVQAKN